MRLKVLLLESMITVPSNRALVWLDCFLSFRLKSIIPSGIVVDFGVRHHIWGNEVIRVWSLFIALSSILEDSLYLRLIIDVWVFWKVVHNFVGWSWIIRYLYHLEHLRICRDQSSISKGLWPTQEHLSVFKGNLLWLRVKWLEKGVGMKHHNHLLIFLHRLKSFIFTGE